METVPDYVIEVLAEVRETGATNMFNRRAVINIAEMIDDDAALWLDENPKSYMDALNAMGKYITEGKSE
jgi:hypothetical protein